MPLPPSIPTSFVPHPASASAATRRFKTDYTGAFGFFAYGVFIVVFALAIGVFSYGRILSASQASKDAELAKKVDAIDPSVVEGFVRLRNRLASGQTLLENHLTVSRFFVAFGTLVPTTVRLSSLHFSLGSDGTPKVDGSGVAKSFNALAFASTAFASDSQIRDVIFSNLTINAKDGSVSFSLSATLDSKLVAFLP